MSDIRYAYGAVLNVPRLKVLVEVAARGSFSAAAEALDYTQSAVSQSIAVLEAETGLALLERDRRGARPTPAGAALLAHAEGILARIEAAEADLASIAGIRGGILRMASFPTAGATLMPLAIARFRASHPDVELRLAEGEPEEIAPRLRSGEFDIALLFEFRGGAGEKLGGGLRRTELLADHMHAALPAGHRLARRKRLALADLRGESWVQVSAESPCARATVRACNAAGFEPDVSFESDDYLTVQGLVAAGVGVALIPQLALSSVREDIVVKAIEPSPPLRRVIAATATSTRLSPAAGRMLTTLAEVAAGYATGA